MRTLIYLHDARLMLSAEKYKKHADHIARVLIYRFKTLVETETKPKQRKSK